MRLIPHIRTRRWIWLAGTLVLCAAWAWSARYNMIAISDSAPSVVVGLGRGRFPLGWSRLDKVRGYSELSIGDPYGSFLESLQLDWLPTLVWEKDVKCVFVPIWPPVLVLGTVTGLAFRKSRRIQLIGECPKCAYDLRGLAPGAKCPECGKV